MGTVKTVEECRRVLAAAFPELQVERVRYLAEGWDSTVFEVNQSLVFRFPKRAAVDATLRKEIWLLPELGERLPARIPRFAFVSGPVLDHPWHVVGYQELSGEFLDTQPPSPETLDQFAGDVARFLQALHAFPAARAAQLGAPVFERAEWAARHAHLFDAARREAQARVPGRQFRAFVAMWEGLLGDPDRFAFEPVLVHGDLAAEHVLVDGNGRLGGVIDFGDAMVADPALDFAGLPDDLARATLARYTADAGERAAIWYRRDLYRHAGPLHAIAAGIELDRPDLMREGIDAIVTGFPAVAAGESVETPRLT